MDYESHSTSIKQPLTDVEWVIVQARFVKGRSFDSIGAELGMARSRIIHILKKAMKKFQRIR